MNIEHQRRNVSPATLIDGHPAMTPMPTDIWVFYARAERLVDGDTFRLRIDQGMHTERKEPVRLLFVDTPEVKGKTRPAGQAAAEYVKRWLDEAGDGDWPLVIRTTETDSFGRYLGTIWRRSDEACLHDVLLEVGHAVPYDG